MNPTEVNGATAARVYRRVAWRTLPLLGLGYLMSYMDRVNIGFAAAQMNADLKFSAAVYGFGGGLFFLSYALMEIPSNLLFQRFGARIWISRIMLTWGLLAAATLFIRNEWEFYIMRLLLGAAEAGFFPAVVVYLSRWFPLESRGRALSTFYVAFPLSSLVMGALAGTLLGLDGHLHLRGWQWLLLVEGLPAIVLAVAIFVWLPERPDQVDWLSPSEKAWLQATLDEHPAAAPHLAAPSMGALLLSPKVVLLGLANALFLGTHYAFTLSAPQVLGLRTGLNAADVRLLISAGGLLGAVSMLANGWHADHAREHFLHVIVPLVVIALGYLVLGAGPKSEVLTVGYLAIVVGSNAFNAVYFVLVSRLFATRALVVGAAAVNMVGQLGSFVLPSLYGIAQSSTGRLDGAVWMLPYPFMAAAVILYSMRTAETPSRVAALAS